jgi:hypothetical protein
LRHDPAVLCSCRLNRIHSAALRTFRGFISERSAPLA